MHNFFEFIWLDLSMYPCPRQSLSAQRDLSFKPRDVRILFRVLECLIGKKVKRE